MLNTEEIRSTAEQLYGKTGSSLHDKDLFDILERGLKPEDQKTLALLDITTFDGAINKLATLEAYNGRAELDLHGRDRNHGAAKVNQAFALGDFSEELKKQNKVETDKLSQEIKTLKETVASLAKMVASNDGAKNKNVNNNNSQYFRGPRPGGYRDFSCRRCLRAGHFERNCFANSDVMGRPLQSRPQNMQPFRPQVPFQPMFGHLQPMQHMQPGHSTDQPSPPAGVAVEGAEHLALPAPRASSE